MALLRGNLHAHTVLSDGVLSPAELIADYEALGYDFLAITDHSDRITPAYFDTLAALTPRLVLFHGVEITWEDGFEQHVGKVQGDREVLYTLNHPARYKLGVEQTLARVAALRAAGLPVSAVEITDMGRHHPLYESEAIPLVKIATDDAHRPFHVGRAWVEVEARRDRDAILRAIGGGEFRVGFAARDG
jgi:hypothetical protein